MRLFNFLVTLYGDLFRVYMQLLGKLRPVTFSTTFFGATFKCARRDFIQRRIAFFGLYEPNLTYFLLHLLRPGDIFIDVGANIGYFTMLASKAVGSAGKVYAIEASPSTFGLLRETLGLNAVANVEAINMAVVDKECHLTIQAVDRTNIGANRVVLAGAADDNVISGRSLPDIVHTDLARARVIKIDVEGAENLILPGLFEYFAQRGSSVTIISEISRQNTALIDLARARGYSVRALTNNYSISHLFIRAYLRRTEEGGFFILKDVDHYVSDQHDYVFTRDLHTGHDDAAAGRKTAFEPDRPALLASVQ